MEATEINLKLNNPEKMSDFNELGDMLYEYISELHSIDENVELRNKQQLMREYLYSDAATELYLFKKDNETIGFGFIGFSDNCHPEADIYIEEFYIKPQYRNNGYGLRFAHMILNDVDSVCFYILTLNEPAKNFWRTVFNEWELDLSVPDINEKYNWLDWYFYKR